MLQLNQLYVIDLKDEIASLQWVTRIIRWVLDQAIDGRNKLGITLSRMELQDTKKFENMIHDKIQELETELEDSNTVREKEVLLNQVRTLQRVLGHLFKLKSGVDDELLTIGAVETNSHYQQANRLKQLNKIQDLKGEISVTMHN